MTEDIDIDAIEAEIFLGGTPQPTRITSPFAWFGGKARLASWIVESLPIGNAYVEPFAGAASVFFKLPRPYNVEVLNDLDHRIINFFRVLQDPDKFKQLMHMIVFTPNSREEFVRAWEIVKKDWDNHDDVMRAWAWYVMINQGLGGIAGNTLGKGSWGRSITQSQPTRWIKRMHTLKAFHNRLMNAQLDCIDALKCIEYWDRPDTVFYIDPPYEDSTWTSQHTKPYTSSVDHDALLDMLLNLDGAAIISGYYNDKYKKLEDAGWVTRKRNVIIGATVKSKQSKLKGSGSLKDKYTRVETLWINPRALELPKLVDSIKEDSK